MSYEASACKKLKKHLKEIMAVSYYSSKDIHEAHIVNSLAHECEKIVDRLESHCRGNNETHKR